MYLPDNQRREPRRPLPASKPPVRRAVRPALRVAGWLFAAFVVLNIAMALLYHGRVLPCYEIATVPVGGIRLDQLDRKVTTAQLLPTAVGLHTGEFAQTATPQQFGLQVDWPATKTALGRARTWLPALSLVRHHSVPVQLRVDRTHFSQATTTLAGAVHRAPLPERVVFKGTSFGIAPPAKGRELQQPLFEQQLLAAMAHKQTTLMLPTTATSTTEPTGGLEPVVAALQKQLGANITLQANGKSKKLGPAEIGRFYESNGRTMQLSRTNMVAVMQEVGTSLGLTPVNQDNAASAALYAIAKSQPVTFVLASSHSRVYRYCTATRGVGKEALPDFQQKLAAVYGDPRGWNQGGVTLVYAESDCDYTAWLSAPEYMTGFGAICDSYYSCRSGPNVVINHDRWMGATDPWNAAKGSLEDYRVMVINHETGHWFGFEHRNCTSPGQPAPVMQQQSIDLQGCTFNPWPTQAEITTLKRSLG